MLRSRSWEDDPGKSKTLGFNAAAKPGLTAKYEATAKYCRERFIARGELGFSDVRAVVKGHLTDIPLSTKLSRHSRLAFARSS